MLYTFIINVSHKYLSLINVGEKNNFWAHLYYGKVKLFAISTKKNHKPLLEREIGSNPNIKYMKK